MFSLHYACTHLSRGEIVSSPSSARRRRVCRSVAIDFPSRYRKRGAFYKTTYLSRRESYRQFVLLFLLSASQRDSRDLKIKIASRQTVTSCRIPGSLSLITRSCCRFAVTSRVGVKYRMSLAQSHVFFGLLSRSLNGSLVSPCWR